MPSRVLPASGEIEEPEKRRAFRASDLRQAYEQQDRCCAACGRRLVLGEIGRDHILPLELGGETALSNLQLLCAVPCHAIKTAQDIKRIAKARRLRRKAGTDPSTPPVKPKRRIASRGFGKSFNKLPSRPFPNRRAVVEGE